MSITRRRRVRAYQDEVRARSGRRRSHADARVARIQRFDDALVPMMARFAIAIFVLVAVVALLA
jgi:hypothetical protein